MGAGSLGSGPALTALTAVARYAIRGPAVGFRGDPFLVPADEALWYEPDAVVAIRGERIADIGPAADVLARLPPATPVVRYPRALLMPGFIDCHVHYPQLGIAGAVGYPLLDWLERYTFPAEAAFADAGHAGRVAAVFLDQLRRNGTTTAAVYGTVHPQSVDALFTAALPTGLRVFAGKALMDRNAPAGLLDTARRGYDESKGLIARWHGRGGRLHHALTLRFVATSTPEQLEATAALWREHPGMLLQSHLAENTAELGWVHELFPEARDYTDVFDRFGLLGPGAVFGHGIHLSALERERLAASGAAIAHCPTSNLALGSGLFDVAATRSAGVMVGLATDVGAGTTLSMLATMGAAMLVARLRGASLHPAQALWLATAGAARTLGLGAVTGNLAPGLDADLVVINPASTPLLAERMTTVTGIDDVLTALMTLGDDRNVVATYAGGRRVFG